MLILTFELRIPTLSLRTIRPANKSFQSTRKREKRHYNSCIMNIEHGTFTPLVFSINGGAGPECLTFHRHLAERIATKTEERYEKIISLIRVKLSFIILRSSLMCIRGSRSHGKRKGAENIEDIEITCDEARIPWWISWFYMTIFILFFLLLYIGILSFTVIINLLISKKKKKKKIKDKITRHE